MATTFSSRICAAAALVVATASCVLLLAPPAYSQTLSSYNAALTGLQTAAQSVLATLMVQSSPSDPRYYADGAWYQTNDASCWYCYDAAMVGAATLSQADDNQSLAQAAIHTFNHAISDYQLPNGAFPDAPGGSPDNVGTGFFTVDLGITYLELQNTLQPAMRATWSAAIEKAASYLISSGDTTWYINGNVNLRQTEVLWIAWAITHQQRFLTAYNSEWAFTIAPPQQRWPGYGLHITKNPTRSDGSDGAGYLAESNGQDAPGFDGNYTYAQLDTATDLYVLTHDPRYLRLMNLEFNQLRPLINSAWTLNAHGGTRDNFNDPFMSAAVSVLAASGDRPDLVPDVSSELASVEAQYKQATLLSVTNVNFYKGFEGWVSMPLLNRQWPLGMATSPNTSVTVDVRPQSTNISRLVRGGILIAVHNASIGSTVAVSLTRGMPSIAFATSTRRHVKSSDVRLSLKLSTRRSARLRKTRGPLFIKVIVRSTRGVDRQTLTL